MKPFNLSLDTWTRWDAARLFWFGTVLLRDFFAFVGEGPFALYGLLGFAGGLGDFVDAEVLEEVDAHLAGYCDVQVAVFVEIEGEDLGAYAGGAVVRNGYAGEGGVGVDFVGVDHIGVVGAGVASIVTAVAFAGDEPSGAVSFEVGEGECVRL